MLKNELFLKAMAADCFKNKSWVISAFSLFSEDENKWRLNPYPYRIIRSLTGYFYIDKDNPSNMIRIDDADVTKPLFYVHDPIEIDSFSVINCADKITTTIGRVLLNYYICLYPFGNKIPFINGEYGVSTIMDIVAKGFTNTPDDPNKRRSDLFYVDEYLKLCEVTDFIKGFTQLFCWAGTEKALSTHPDVPKRKKELLEQYKDSLNSPATIALISEELRKLDAQHLSDDPAKHYFLSKKSKEVNRSKLFLIGGAEVGLEENAVKVDLIQNSLKEGWDVEKLPTMIDSLRAGSFNRGAQTVLGGVAFKELLRASSNLRIGADDCGAKLGKMFDVGPNNFKRLIGRYVLTSKGPTLINDKEEAGAYLGKKIMVRSPQYCRLSKTDYCRVCVGKKLSISDNALPIAVSDYGSVFLYVFMKAAHGKATILEKMNLQDVLF